MDDPHSRTCERCDNRISGHVLLCASCYDDDAAYDDHECANCGGEGFTLGCSWDWQCDTWDGDSCLCTRRCDWCNLPSDAELAKLEKLRDILATALAPHPNPPTPRR